MGYISCHKGNTHSRYEQSAHVKQAIRLQYSKTHETLIYCTIRVQSSNTNSAEDSVTLVLGLTTVILALLFISIYRKL